MKKIFTILGIAALGMISNAQVVINEVYGGGGNSGATYTHDFIELYNAGSSAVNLGGLYLWYGSGTGVMGGSDGALVQELPAFTLAPGAVYLIQQAPGAGGTTPLPSPNFVPTTPFNMAAANFKVALTNSNVAPTAANASNVVDFVGVGTANLFEGTGAAPAASNATSVTRTNGVDTNNNAADFTAIAPTPGTALLSVSEVNGAKAFLVRNTVVSETLTFAKSADVQIINTAGQIVKTVKVNEGTVLNVSSLAKGIYFVTGSVNGQKVSQKIIKQ